MDINDLKQPINQYLERVSQVVKIDQVIVFGSYLEGNATEDSDVDIVVVSDDFKDLDEDQRFAILHPVRRDIEPGIDPWGFTQEELEKASQLTIWGYVRDHGIRVL